MKINTSAAAETAVMAPVCTVTKQTKVSSGSDLKP
jgi:hypothetical protein